METIYEHAGGYEALHRFVDIFYGSVLADPLLQPLFGAGRPEHVTHLTAFDAEAFGGPDDFTRDFGFGALIEVHRGLKITEEQRQRFVELYLAAADRAGLPGDAGSARRCGSMSSSAARSPTRTRTPRPMTSCTRCARSRTGGGRTRSRRRESAGRTPR